MKVATHLAPTLFLALAWSTFSAAVEQEEQADNESGELEEVVVLGSKIRGHQNPSARVVSIDREEMLKQGLATTDDIFRSITQVFSRGATAATDTNDQAPSGSTGHSSVDIGGFGSKATLVLINGRRTASSSIMYGDSVNLGAIPASAIERVEVLPAGAAAIYGADAVGGVVNIILKKDAQFSANTRVRLEDSGYGGDAAQFSQDLSFGWGSGRFTGVASVKETDPLTNQSLGFTTQDFRRRGGFDMRSPIYGESGIIDGYGSLPQGHDGVNFVPDDVSPDNIVPTSLISSYVTPEMSNKSLYINFEQDIGERVTVFVDALYSENDTANFETPHTMAFVAVPASNAFNPFGETVFVNYAFDTESETGQVDTVFREADQELTQVTLGASYEFGNDWNLNAYITDADEESLHTFSWMEYWADPVIADALADSDPATALNPFGDGTVQNQDTLSSLVGYWQGQRHNQINSGMRNYVVQTDGSLFAAPAGDVKASFSIERREESFNWAGFGVNQPDGERIADSIAAEFAVPLVGPGMGIGDQSIDLTIAARWDRYNAEGDFNYDGITDKMNEISDTSPMFGISWQLSDNLRLRASWNSAFRAPVIHDIAGKAYTSDFTIFDPLAPDDPTTPAIEGPRFVQVTGDYPPSPDVGPERAEMWSAGVDWSAPADSGLAGLSGFATYRNTEFTNRLSSVYVFIDRDASLVVSRPDLFPGIAHRDADGNLTGLSLKNINIAGQNSKAWNLGAAYAWDTEAWGSFTVGVDTTYTAEFVEQVHAEAQKVELDGTYNGPDSWRSVYRAGWVSSQQDFAANIYLRTSSSYTNRIPTTAIYNADPALGDEVIESVDGYTTVDLSATYYHSDINSWFDGTTASVGVRNLLDEDFPLIHVTSGRVMPYDPRRVDPRGRIFYLEIQKTFE